MSKTVLYMAPGTCARVACILLEQAGMKFDTQVIRFLAGEHKRAPYTDINPRGKVPALVIDDRVLTENVAITWYLNQRFPDARLLPVTRDTGIQAEQLADLAFCASTLHPLVTRIRLPGFFAGKEAARQVYDLACSAMKEYFQLIDNRLAGGPWWYGDQWSAMDAYLYWIFWRVEGAGFPVMEFPCYQEHKKRMEELPAVNAALHRETEAEEILKEEGLLFTPPPLTEQ